MSSSKERRHQRFAIDWRAKLSCPDWPAAARVATENASRGGLFVLTNRPPPIGSTVEIKIQLPDGGELALVGQVVHVITPEQAIAVGRGAGVGIKLDSRHEADLLLLESMASAHSEATPPPPAPPGAPEPITLPPQGPPPAAAAARPAAPKPRVTPSAPPAPKPPQTIPPLDIDIDEPEPSSLPVQPPLSTGPIELPPQLRRPERAPPPAPEPAPAPVPAPVPTPTASEPSGPVIGRMRMPRWILPASGTLCPAIGIDFGTTFTSASVVIDGLAYMVPDPEGRVLHPSVVSYPEKAPRLCGWAARERLGHDSRRTVASAKRLLGRAFSDPTLAGYLQSLTYRTAAGPGDSVLVDLGSEQYAVPQVCAAVIDHVRTLAERTLGVTINQVALSCPVTFTEEMKQALRRAAKIAGLETVAMVPEPVAGALAYGIGQEKNELVAVYDFGGGTFDFSLLDIAGDHARVVVTDGDAWLGGDDFDDALAQAVADAFWRATRIELRQKAVEWQRVLLACERVKRELSTESTSVLEIPHLIETPRVIDLRQGVSRQLFEHLCSPLFERSVEVSLAALARAGLEPSDVTQLVLTGGISRIPFVRAGLARVFEREVTSMVSPEEAIALGAGIRAAQAVGHPVRGVAKRQ